MGIEAKSLPHKNTVDGYLSQLDFEQVNDFLLKLFEFCQESKLFYNHAETLLPNNFFHLGVDGFWVHHYVKPHATELGGWNNCPYCLPRVHNRGTPEEKTTWVHVFVTFVMIFPGGMKLPIYVHPLKATQVNTGQSDDKLKQECELIAAHLVLPKIRKWLPKIPLTFLGDSLYANRPMIKLCEELRLDYLIVRKQESLASVGRECDELACTQLYIKNYRTSEVEKIGRDTVQRQYQWFNKIFLGEDLYTNVLRFSETVNSTSPYNNEWLCSRSIHAANCRPMAKRGRLRWNQEDLHNTLKNRGFAAEHDYARANPHLWLIWKLLMFIAFFIFELFSHTLAAIQAKGSRSWTRFAMSLLEQLVNIPWSLISSSTSLQKSRIQFRYLFDTS